MDHTRYRRRRRRRALYIAYRHTLFCIYGTRTLYGEKKNKRCHIQYIESARARLGSKFKTVVKLYLLNYRHYPHQTYVCAVLIFNVYGSRSLQIFQALIYCYVSFVRGVLFFSSFSILVCLCTYEIDRQMLRTVYHLS